jgi:reverse gyrase
MNKIEEEIKLGKQAQQAYDLYLKRFIAEKQEDIFKAFIQVSISEPEKVLELKRLQMALSALETALLSDIETGKLAIIQAETQG